MTTRPRVLLLIVVLAIITLVASTSRAGSIYASGQFLIENVDGTHDEVRENRIFRIDTTTGVATAVSPLFDAGTPAGLARTRSGELLGIKSGSLGSVDAGIGTFNPFGSPLDANSSAFDITSDGRGFLLPFNDDFETQQLFSIDLVTALILTLAIGLAARLRRRANRSSTRSPVRVCRSRLVAIVVGAFCLYSGSSAWAETYTYKFVDVPFEGASETELFGINNHGVAVGSYLDQDGMRRGFILDTQTWSFTDYAVSGATGTRLFGINDTGTMTGYWQKAGGFQHGFFYASGIVTDVDRPGFTTNYAWGINNSGQIAGYVFDFSSGFSILSHQYDIADGTFSEVLYNTAGDGTVTRGINDEGTQVGWSLEPDGSTPGLIYQNGEFTPFSLGSDRSTLPNDINNLGDIVGNVANLDFTGSQGFVRDAMGNVSYLAVPDAEYTQALGINDYGVVVGFFEDESESIRGFVATVIPEPSSLVLVLLGGAGGLLTYCYSRRRFLVPTPKSTCESTTKAGDRRRPFATIMSAIPLFVFGTFLNGCGAGQYSEVESISVGEIKKRNEEGGSASGPAEVRSPEDRASRDTNSN